MSDLRPLLALSNVIIDSVTDCDGTVYPPAAGGAGLYAALAMACWWPAVGLVAGVGEDFMEIRGDAVAAYRLLPDGLIVRDAHCIRSQLIYRPDGNGRTERAVYGPEHFERMMVSPAHIPAPLLPARGTYVFQADTPAFWQELQQRRAALGMVLWEVDCRMTRDNSPAEFAGLADLADIVSLNLDEARDLLGPAAPRILFDRLCGLSRSIVLLRMGDRGALVGAADRQAVHVQPPVYSAIDVTGGGNAFSGGFLAGLCERPDDLVHAGRCAAAAAACAIAQRGPPPPPSSALLDRLYHATTVRLLGSSDHPPLRSEEHNVPVR